LLSAELAVAGTSALAEEKLGSGTTALSPAARSVAITRTKEYFEDELPKAFEASSDLSLAETRVKLRFGILHPIGDAIGRFLETYRELERLLYGALEANFAGETAEVERRQAVWSQSSEACATVMSSASSWIRGNDSVGPETAA
jgi:hypothetical protein